MVAEGATVAVGDKVAEIETDKAVVEYEAEVSGTIGRLLVEAGTNVEVGSPIAIVLGDGESLDDMDVSSPLSPVSADSEEEARGHTGEPTANPPLGGLERDRAETGVDGASGAGGVNGADGVPTRRFVSPLVRK
ncbi:pyruvate dehydrogenase complex dihydrolipoamide acetyltransferase, partial [Salmonella enterica]|nr:pyruvate dehydrogenase complex dihydrolipoamide acetyltransferase [Salmonella enterica]